MVWEALLYFCGAGISIWILLLSRHLVSIKRWYDVSFLQGMALLAWSLANLAALSSDELLRLLEYPMMLLFYVFLLLSLHAFPRLPHLYYDHWKTLLDTAMLASTYVSAALCMWFQPVMSFSCYLQLHMQSSIFLLIHIAAVWITNAQTRAALRSKGQLLINGILAFVLVDAISPFLPSAVTFVCGAGALLLISLSPGRLPTETETVSVQDEYVRYYEKWKFQQIDASMVMVLVFAAITAIVITPDRTAVYFVGMGLTLMLGLIRLILTIRQNRRLLAETFLTASSLEQKFAEQLEQIQSKNARLSQLLFMRQSYENLLVASNELHMCDVSYENLPQVMEELVDTWLAKMDGLFFLRLSLESADGSVYYQVIRGNNNQRVNGKTVTVTERIVVDEALDSPLCPRFVNLIAMTVSHDAEEMELEQSFFQLLAVNVRGLILRCLQDNQALELRLMEQEMELAKKIQFSLIPRERLVLPQLQAKAVFLPVTYVGGDYVDYFPIDDRYTCFLVADASGHGIPASLLTTGIRSALRAVIQTTVSPDEILYRLNRLLYEDLSKTRSFITMLIVVYDAAEHKLRISRAGHPQPLYFTAEQGSVLPCAGGIGLGLVSNSSYTLEEWPITRDGLLLIYTDGMLELGRKDGHPGVRQWLVEFGNLLEQKRAAGEDRLDAVEQHIWKMTRNLPRTDDISLLILDFSVESFGVESPQKSTLRAPACGFAGSNTRQFRHLEGGADR
jgi:serine phosphatase RsbU (regulator of sigma subunit)